MYFTEPWWTVSFNANWDAEAARAGRTKATEKDAGSSDAPAPRFLLDPAAWSRRRASESRSSSAMAELDGFS